MGSGGFCINDALGKPLLLNQKRESILATKQSSNNKNNPTFINTLQTRKTLAELEFSRWCDPVIQLLQFDSAWAKVYRQFVKLAQIPTLI